MLSLTLSLTAFSTVSLATNPLMLMSTFLVATRLVKSALPSLFP